LFSEGRSIAKRDKSSARSSEIVAHAVRGRDEVLGKDTGRSMSGGAVVEIFSAGSFCQQCGQEGQTVICVRR
jgi:hypothetical protein